MNLIRLTNVFGMELRRTLRRPSLWILVVILVLIAYGLTQGNVQIASGDASVGGTKAYITSEYSVAFILGAFLPLVYLFFVFIGAGMAIPEDDELNVGPLLHATPLTAGEYVWGKFLAILTAYVLVLALQVAAMITCNHLAPNFAKPEIIGPFAWSNYLRPGFWFGLPTLFAFAAGAFALGELTRRPILIYLLPVAFMLGALLFLYSWSPGWLDPRLNQLLMIADPSGFRWFLETWMKVDRGVAVYNHKSVGFDWVFYLNRVLWLTIGLGAMLLSQWHFARSLRGVRSSRAAARLSTQTPSAEVESVPTVIRDAGKRRPLSFVGGLLQVAWFEVRQLLWSPGLYLFVPLIMVQSLTNTLAQVGFLDTEPLQTPGLLAVRLLNGLTVMVCLLLLFYTVESLERERATGVAPLFLSTPVLSASILFGKVLANGLVGVVILLAMFLMSWGVLLYQGQVPIDPAPFAIVWGLLLTPTFLVWVAFVLMLHALLRNRYASYALSLGVLILFGWLQYTERVNWVSNWMLWSAIRWSDMGVLELDRLALVLNRVFVLGLTILCVVLTLRWYRRRDLDPVGIAARLQPWPLIWEGLRIAPFCLVPVIAGVWLYLEVQSGMDGAGTKRRYKEYWQQNLATWKDAPLPALKDVSFDLEIDPPRSWFRVSGSYLLANDRPDPVRQIPLTGGLHWKDLTWTLDGQEFTPENRSGLYVFDLPKPLAEHQTVRIGFAFEATYPFGISKNAMSAGQFVLPSGVVLNSFSTAFAPVVGYVEDLGVDKENRYEPRKYAADYHLRELPPLFGSATPFTTRIRITGPPEYQFNAAGTLVHDEIVNGRRTVEWRSDHPVRIFNIIGGKWDVRRGEGVALYLHPAHRYNADAMIEALEGSRKYFSEWFAPFPWQELRLSEFPNLADYAQGFATNVVFTEAIALTKEDPAINSAFFITAHEAAHQWWGNLLTPGKGPGANILSEGLAHYSTMLLLEQMKGPHARIAFCERIEDNYAKRRRHDSEQPMVRIQGDKPGDTTVTYDKGAWVFWMLHQHLGREKMLAGLQAFLQRYRVNRDHPMLEDLIAELRPFATDPAAFDRFTRLWFFDVVLPEYQLSDVKKSQTADGWHVTLTVKNAGTGRMPVAVAAVNADRFKDGQPNPDSQDAQQIVELGAGESQQVTIRTAFEPSQVIVDPDAVVLQLFRKKARQKL